MLMRQTGRLDIRFGVSVSYGSKRRFTWLHFADVSKSDMLSELQQALGCCIST